MTGIPAGLRIVSGGQAGVDRAALEAAVAHGLAYGGWCPAGGRAEDLPDPPGVRALFPGLAATASADPAERTRRNVRDSAATVVVRGADPGGSPGTALTIRTARDLGRPLLVVDPRDPRAAGAVRRFLSGLPAGAAVNVAGPRESECPGIGAAARSLLDRALSGG